MSVHYRFTGSYRRGDKRREHRAVAEKILGRPLHGTECVHHVDGDGANNAHSNLVICPTNAYHVLLHRREKALNACGNPDFRQCQWCREWSDVALMRAHGNGVRWKHPRCHAEEQQQRYWAMRQREIACRRLL